MAARPSRSAARLAAILDQLPDALLLVDSSGRIVNANARAIEAFQAGELSSARPRSVIGLPLLQLLPGFGHRRAPGMTPRRDGGRRAAPERMVAHSLDGASFPVDVSRSVLSWGDDGELLLLVIRLTSDSGAAEPGRWQRQTEAILRAADQALCGIDADGRIVLTNPSASRLLGLRASEAAGKDLHAAALHTRVDGSPYLGDSSPLADTLRTGRTHRKQLEVLGRDDGTPVPVELSSVAVKEGDEVVGAIAAFTDTTLELDLDGRRERLVSVLQDDLRPQLASLREVVRRLRDEDSQEAADRLLQQAWRASQRLLSILDAAVAHEQFVSGAIQADCKPADIGEMVERAVEATAQEAAAGGVSVAVRGEPIVINADAERVIAALTEFLTAAIAASTTGSTVTVTTSLRGRYVRVVVRDTGASPPEKPRDHPLLQRLLPRPAGAQASHLNVAFVQAVADRHDGRFVVETAEGGSLAYTLELPLPAPELRQAPPSGSTRARHAAPAAATTSVPTPARQQVLVWPGPHEAMTHSLAARGWCPVAVPQPREVTEHALTQAAALLVDPLTGPVTRRLLSEVRAVAVTAGLPMLVAAGLGEIASDAAHGSDPAALIGALRPPGATASRVLLLEEDPALAALVCATLERRGMHALVARSESEAMLRAAVVPPDMVFLDLSLPPAPRPGILDWLRAQGRLHETPVVAFTAAELDPDHDQRLRTGRTVLSVQARTELPGIDDRIAELVLQLAGTPEPW